MKIKAIAVILLSLLSSMSFAQAPFVAAAEVDPMVHAWVYAPPPWAIMFYHGWMTNSNIGPLLFQNDVRYIDGTIESLEFSHPVAEAEDIQKFFRGLAARLETAGNITYRRDPAGTILEFDPYLMLRWQDFFWNKGSVLSSFAVGDGLSYATKIPVREVRDSSTESAKRLLNLLVIEITLTDRDHPNWELVGRIHHRCGAWGLFGAGNVSSNVLGVGVRYRF